VTIDHGAPEHGSKSPAHAIPATYQQREFNLMSYDIVK
jgi:hypothetical protein